MHSPRAAVASPSPPTGRSLKRKCTPCRSPLLLQRPAPCSFLEARTNLVGARPPPARLAYSHGLRPSSSHGHEKDGYERGGVDGPGLCARAGARIGADGRGRAPVRCCLSRRQRQRLLPTPSTYGGPHPRISRPQRWRSTRAYTVQRGELDSRTMIFFRGTA
jgi:hypothetical protein